MTIPILQPTHRWWCPYCPQTDITHEARPHSRMHVCPGRRGLSIAFIAVGTKAKVEIREPEDYVGNSIPRLDEAGRPVMSAVTTRDDGEDTVVYAPTIAIRAGV